MQLGVSQGVQVQRCRYLEEAGCTSICVNSCKVPTQVRHNLLYVQHSLGQGVVRQFLNSCCTVTCSRVEGVEGQVGCGSMHACSLRLRTGSHSQIPPLSPLSESNSRKDSEPACLEKTVWLFVMKDPASVSGQAAYAPQARSLPSVIHWPPRVCPA
eukprot:1159100-Pelagomonas_calceolata.AAC.3